MAIINQIALEAAKPASSSNEETTNKKVVVSLYEALASRDAHEVQKLLASDLEWWFHGPPSHQFLMHLLTGTTSADAQDLSNTFHFTPQSIVAFGSLVIAEGCDHNRSISWVHAWTVNDGIITQVREYFNTSVTVTRVGNRAPKSNLDLSAPPSDQNQITGGHHHHCQPLWESSLSGRAGKSVPGLVLAL
uniref:Wound-induced protein 1 n=1 Tax=Chenopodium quinoa TaxID=63459 RepID=A0A803M419_CHEQI